MKVFIEVVKIYLAKSELILSRILAIPTDKSRITILPFSSSLYISPYTSSSFRSHEWNSFALMRILYPLIYESLSFFWANIFSIALQSPSNQSSAPLLSFNGVFLFTSLAFKNHWQAFFIGIFIRPVFLPSFLCISKISYFWSSSTFFLTLSSPAGKTTE